MKYAKKAGYIAALILFLIFAAGPFVWTFIISITPDHAMFAPTPELLPGEVTFENYKELFSGGQRGSRFFESMYNSLRAVAITLCIGVPVAVMSAYALSRMEFKGRKVIKNLLLITMVIPVMATIIPLYQMFAAGKKIGENFLPGVLSEHGVCQLLPAYGSLADLKLFCYDTGRTGRSGTDRWMRKICKFFPHHPAAFLSDYFVCDFDHVFKYVESVSDPADPCLLDGDKTDGDRGVRVYDKGYHSVRADRGSRDAGPDPSGADGADLPEISDLRNDKGICKRITVFLRQRSRAVF